MSCGSCTTTKNGVPKGCKSNGNCGTGSCGNKLGVFDWLANMNMPNDEDKIHIIEVRFKNGRKHFYRNEKRIPIQIGDIVSVEGNPGHDIGTVSLTGELIRIQMKKKGISEDSEEVKKIYRKATQREINTWQEARAKEVETQKRGREIILRLGLTMKLSDVEYQGDGNKATFYYTAEGRVDFRQLIKELASTFSIRVEMKQVGFRQEAARLGGIGSCGRELCCSTWLTDFRKVNTAAARYQQLSLNPQKLSGQCGKLKCCLNYELDTYVEALKSFPKTDVVLKTENGPAFFVKMDIFKEVLWYSCKTKDSDFPKWHKLDLEQVLEIISLNEEGETKINLEEYESDIEVAPEIQFKDAVGQDSLTRFDAPKRKRRRKPQRRNKAKQGAEKDSSPNAKKTTNRNANRNRNNPRNKNQATKDATNKSDNSSENKNVNPSKKEGNTPAKNNRNRNRNRKNAPKKNTENTQGGGVKRESTNKKSTTNPSKEQRKARPQNPKGGTGNTSNNKPRRPKRKPNNNNNNKPKGNTPSNNTDKT